MSEVEPRRADIKPFTIVFNHELNDTEITVAMAANHDLHFRITDPLNYNGGDHVMTMTDFDELVEKVHAFHAEVPNEPA